MGKNQHSKDKLYIIPSEYQRDWGGYKNQSKDVPFHTLPFDCCALSLSPFTTPVGTPTGIVFDKDRILPYIKKYHRNPVDGKPLAIKDLHPLYFHKDSQEQYHCPVTFKVFTPHTHIVANLKSGHIYANEAIDNLCRKSGNWEDPMTSAPMTNRDIVDIQNPHEVHRRKPSNFKHVSEKHDEETDDTGGGVSHDGSDGKATVVLTPLMEKILEQTDKIIVRPFPKVEAQTESGPPRKKHKLYTTGQAAASLTSTVMGPHVHGGATEFREMTEDEWREELWSRVKAKGKKSYVQLKTTIGNLNLELHSDLVPSIAHNFVLLCQRGKYTDTIFHRSIKNFVIQGGCPHGKGTGGESAFGEFMKDEFNPKIVHRGTGVLSMANDGTKHRVKSQFFITYKSCEHLNFKNSVFGHVVGGLDTLKRMEALPTNKKDRPLVPPKILEVVVFDEPYTETEAEMLKEEEAVEPTEEDSSNAASKEKELPHPLLRNSTTIGKYIQM